MTRHLTSLTKGYDGMYNCNGDFCSGNVVCTSPQLVTAVTTRHHVPPAASRSLQNEDDFHVLERHCSRSVQKAA